MPPLNSCETSPVTETTTCSSTPATRPTEGEPKSPTSFGSWKGLIDSIYTPGSIDGWSGIEKHVSQATADAIKRAQKTDG